MMHTSYTLTINSHTNVYIQTGPLNATLTMLIRELAHVSHNNNDKKQQNDSSAQ